MKIVHSGFILIAVADYTGKVLVSRTYYSICWKGNDRGLTGNDTDGRDRGTFEILSRIFPELTEENHSASGQPEFWPCLERDTNPKQVQNITAAPAGTSVQNRNCPTYAVSDTQF